MDTPMHRHIPSRAAPAARRLGVLLLALVLPVAAFAQTPSEGRRGRARWVEVERGLYATGTIGAGFVVSPPADDGEQPTVSGLAMGVAAGFDLFDRVQLEGFVSGLQIQAPPGYGGLGGPADPRGDFAAVLAGGRARVAFLTFADVQDVDRFFVHVQAGAAGLFSEPSTVFGDTRTTLLGGLGFRYYTRMRHFSLGLDVEGAYALDLDTVMVLPQASLTYTF